MLVKFWLTVSTNGVSIWLCQNRITSAFFGSGSDVLGCDWRRNFFKRRWFFFFRITTRLSCKTMCNTTVNQHNCQFLVLKRSSQNVAAGFALFTVVETSHFIGWNVNTLFISKCWTIHISNSLLYFVVLTQFFLLFLGNWNGTLGDNCLLGTNFIFFYQRKSVFCLFLSSLRALVTSNELCEQTTRLHTFHNHKWISEFLHNRQKIRISPGSINTCQDNTHFQ